MFQQRLELADCTLQTTARRRLEVRHLPAGVETQRLSIEVISVTKTGGKPQYSAQTAADFPGNVSMISKPFKRSIKVDDANTSTFHCEPNSQ